MSKYKSNITIRIDRSTFEPVTAVPKRKHHRLLFQLALLYFGEAEEEGRQIDESLMYEVVDKLKAIRKNKLGDLAWDTTLMQAVQRAYAITQAGTNHLYSYHSGRDGDQFALRV
jgi:hypothetical protein